MKKSAIIPLLLLAVSTAFADYMQGPNSVLALDANKLSQLIGVGQTNVVDLTYAATISINPDAGMMQRITTTAAVGNATVDIAYPSNFGRMIWLDFNNDASAGRTITFGSTFFSTPPLVGTPSTSAILCFFSNGSKWKLVSNSQTAFAAANPTMGIGYTTGAGGAVAQASSRTTGVTLNTVSGDITLVSAAGSATFASFTVTDSAVGVNDTPIIVAKTATDLYEIHVTTVAAGSFKVTFRTTGGTTTETPIFHFNIIKGSNS